MPEKKAPAKLVKKEDDDFKAGLAAMLARGPSYISRRPAARMTAVETMDQVIDARLALPGVTKQRGATTKYNVDKYNFDDF